MKKADQRSLINEDNSFLFQLPKSTLRGALSPISVVKSPSQQVEQINIPSRGCADIGTPSTQINQSQFSRYNQSQMIYSRQSNIRGFFLREQLSREDVWHQTEFKRRTKESLDQQIEEKKTLHLKNSREIQIHQFQELNNQKSNSMFDKKSSLNSMTQNSPSRLTPIAFNNEILTQVDEEYDISQQTKFFNDLKMRAKDNTFKEPNQSSNFDITQIQNILQENQILKHRLSQKQATIETLIRQKKDNIRQQALQDIQENYMKNSKLQSSQKRLNFLPPTKQFQDLSALMKTPQRVVKKASSQIKKSVPSATSSHVTTQNSFNLRQNLTVSRDQAETNPQLKNTQNTSLKNELNNFTFSTNLVEQLKSSAQNYQSNRPNLNSRLLKEFPQDNLRRKFCV